MVIEININICEIVCPIQLFIFLTINMFKSKSVNETDELNELWLGF
jgi:hypothetical protein